MRLGIKGKQVLGVTSLVGVVVVVLSVLHLSTLARVSLEESRARAELLANAIYHRAREVVDDGDLARALREDSGLRSILESSLYSKNLIFAAIADVHNKAIVHADRSLHGQVLAEGDDLSKLLERPPLVAAPGDLQRPGTEHSCSGIRCCGATPSSARFVSASRRS